MADSEAMMSLIEASQRLCKEGGFNLHKFMSNNISVLDKIQPAQRAKDVQSVDLMNEDLPVDRTLGVQWDVQADAFKFSVKFKDQKPTRRGILSTVASIFDPIGLLSPFVLTGKCIIQEITTSGADWDEELPADVIDRWQKWKHDAKNLAQFEIPRCYKPREFGTVKSIQLHHFSDASTTGYGQCSYVRLVNIHDAVSTSLVMAKSRVIPAKPITVPRLELAAAVLSVEVSKFLRKELHYDTPTMEEYFWTDSQVVLGYINNEAKRFRIFAVNRIEKIREHSSPEQWRYVESASNPADIASRGTGADELMGKEMWWKGTTLPLILGTISSREARRSQS